MKVKNSKRLGELAVEEGVLQRAQLEDCLATQRAIAELGCSKKLGEVMVDKSLATQEQLEQLLRLQREQHQVRTLGGYELGAKLGQGGMGAVLRATRKSDGVQVALKFLSKLVEAKPGYIERFEREAHLASTLFHPHLVRTYGPEQLERHRVLVMEFVDGETLERRLRTEGPLSEQAALALALQLALALAYLGSKRIVHRDIKPANVMIDAAGNAKLLDLGLARQEGGESPLTMTGQVIGTPDFMAPEQITGRPLDTRTDVYALGATLYMMCTAQAPYAGRGDHQAVLMAHLSGTLRDPRELVSGLSESTARVIARAMATRPEDRYQDMESFAADLEAAALGRSIRPAPTGGGLSTSSIPRPADANPVPDPTETLPQLPEAELPVLSAAQFPAGPGVPSPASLAPPVPPAPRPRSRAAALRRVPKWQQLATMVVAAAVVVAASAGLIAGLRHLRMDESTAGRGPRLTSPVALTDPTDPPGPVVGISTHADAAHARAQAAYHQDNYSAALVDIDLALASEPERAESHYLRGAILFRLDRVDDARLALARSLRIDPSSWSAWRLTAEILERQGDREAAIAHYERARDVAPANERQRLATRVRQLEQMRIPPPPVLPPRDPPPVAPPPDPDAPRSIPADEVQAIERHAADWNFGAARTELTRLGAMPRHARAATQLSADIDATERAARVTYAAMLARAADTLATAGDYGAATNQLRRALTYTDDDETIQRGNVRIEQWHREADRSLRQGLAELKNYLGAGAVDAVRQRLEAFAKDPLYSGYGPALAKMLRELQTASPPDRALGERWLAALPATVLFVGEEGPPAGPICPHCEGRAFALCPDCDAGKAQGQCPECSGTGAVGCARCKGARTQACARCDGDGKRLGTKTERETCPQCNGRGVVGRSNTVCPKCRGSARVEVTRQVQLPCETCNQTGKVACEACRESGQRACPQCRGVGRGLIDHERCGGTARAYCAPCRGHGVATALLPLPQRSTLPPELLAARRARRPEGIAPYFARRLDRGTWVARFGGSAITERVVDAGLAWLADHQHLEGYWDADGFMANDPPGDACTGPSKLPWVDPGVTGLALLALLGAGETHERGGYQDAVARALKYMMRNQNANGLIGGTRGHYLYNHAICALALAEAYGMTRDPLIEDGATRAIAYLLAARNPEMAWRYGERDGDNDVSVTGWCVCALASAKAAELQVDGIDEGMRQALAWVEEVTDPESGISGYKSPPPRGWEGVTSSRFQNDEIGVNTANTHRGNHTPTAIATLCRIHAGYRAHDVRISNGAAAVAKLLPTWDVGGGGRLSQIDYYSWYYGTLAMFQSGGPGWGSWNSAVVRALVPHQESKRAARGSWDPIDAWGFGGGRVYATAINVLTLETYYRYTR